MSESIVIEIIGELQREGRTLTVESCRSPGADFVRLRTTRWDGRAWAPHHTMTLQLDELAGVVEALTRELERSPEGADSARRRRLDRVRDRLKSHEARRGRTWPSES